MFKQRVKTQTDNLYSMLGYILTPFN